MNTLERILYSIVFIILIFGIILSHFYEAFFLNHYILEDGPLEWSTCIMLTLCAGLFFWRAWKLKKVRTALFIAITVLGGFVMVFGAGEEISWGQRIFGWETSEEWAEINKQNETNLHNLKIKGVSINKLIFSKLLAVGLVIYLLVLPPLSAKKKFFKNLTEKFAIPIPTNIQIIMWILALAIPEVLVATKKKGEVREAAIGFVLFATLYRPRNPYIYDTDHELED